MSKSYTDDINPYKKWHMRRAFRLGWEAAEQGLDMKRAQARAQAAKLNRQTHAAWWRGFNTMRGGR
jgi:hypothetical protein